MNKTIKKIIAIIIMICLLLALDYIIYYQVLYVATGTPVYKHGTIIYGLKWLALIIVNLSLLICLFRTIVKKDDNYGIIVLGIIVFSIIVPIILIAISIKVRDYDSGKGYYSNESEWKTVSCMKRDSEGNCIKYYEGDK